MIHRAYKAEEQPGAVRYLSVLGSPNLTLRYLLSIILSVKVSITGNVQKAAFYTAVLVALGYGNYRFIVRQ